MIKDKSIFVLDSYALLAFLENEIGSQRVHELLDLAKIGKIQVSMSIINLGEVLYITERERGLPITQKVLALIEELPITIEEATRDLVFGAAHIKARHAVSYADAFAAAQSILQKAILITGDTEFKSIEKEITIEWI